MRQTVWVRVGCNSEVGCREGSGTKRCLVSVSAQGDSGKEGTVLAGDGRLGHGEARGAGGNRTKR